MKIKHLVILIPYFLYASLIFGQDTLMRSQPDTLQNIKSINEPIDTSRIVKTPMDTVEYSNGVIYIGVISNKARNGFGTLISPYGDTLYSGSYVMNQREGLGKYFFKNKNVYEGNWVKGEMHGQGKMYYAVGDVYEGEWKNDNKHGKGTFTYKNGDVYVGEFVDGIREGMGTMTQKTQTYEGNWVQGAREGEGTMIIDAGGSREEYIGTFESNRYHGMGSWKYQRDDIITEYIGNWVDGYRIGEGQYILNGRTLEGVWKRNEATGTGVGVGGEGIYEGEFYRGFFQGEGKFTYAIGDSYEGSWIRGKRQGYGVYSYADGSKYDGEWHMDLRHGQGIVVSVDGISKTSKFKEGKPEE